jgi:hypothetical protein
MSEPIVLSKGDSQILLYAKGHFLQTELLEDLRILVADRCGLNPCDTLDQDVVAAVCHLMEVLGLPSRPGFLSRVSGNFLFPGLQAKSQPYVVTRFLELAMGELSCTRVLDSRRVIQFIDIQPADYTLLPPSPSAAKRMAENKKETADA